jgi:hypothetical protein
MRHIALLLTLSVSAWAGENLEKQADQAIDQAARLAKELKASYDSGDWKKTLEGIAASAESGRGLLKDSGKSGRKSPKYYKRAELKTREILRRLETFSADVSVDDREPVEKIRARVQKVHDELLSEIMGTK